MKANVEVTFGDLRRTLSTLAHDLADQAEAGYRPRMRQGGDLRRADRLNFGSAPEKGESHDGAGR
jgi:hypothetical protein